MKVIVAKNNYPLVTEVEMADTYLKRLCGLMFRRRLSDHKGLLIKPCKQIHTHFMNFAVDAIFLDKDNKIVHVEHSMVPWRFSAFFKSARSVLEVNAGAANGLQPGDELYFI